LPYDLGKGQALALRSRQGTSPCPTISARDKPLPYGVLAIALALNFWFGQKG